MWFIFSALMLAAEHTGADLMLEEEEMNKRDVKLVTSLISSQRELLANNTELRGQLDKLLVIMETNPLMPELFGKLNLEMALVKHDMMTVILGLFRDEFVRIKEELGGEDTGGRKLSEELITFFSDNKRGRRRWRCTWRLCQSTGMRTMRRVGITGTQFTLPAQCS